MNEVIPSLMDIVQPAIPEMADAGVSFLLPGVALALLLIALWFWHRRRHQRRVRAQLRILQKKYHAGEITQRELAYRLAAQLRDSAGQHRLQAPHATWQSLVQQLDALRYQPHYEVDITALLAQVRRSLR